MTPVSPEPIWLASRMRCASPPDSVSAERSSERYSSPTFTRNCRRFRISRTIFSAIACFTPGSSRPWKNPIACASGSAETS